MVGNRGVRVFVNLLLVIFLILPSLLLGITIAEAQDCVVIQKIGFDRPEPFSEGDRVQFGASIGNRCGQTQTFNVECRIDGQLWDSGSIPVGGGQSITIWADNYWTATTGSHTLTLTADGSSSSRSFSVSGGVPPPPPPTSDHRVWTDKSTYQVGEAIKIGVSPTPAIGVKYWLIIRNPNGSESRIELAPGSDTVTIQASSPVGQYKVEKWGQVVTYPQPSASLLASCYYSVLASEKKETTRHTLTIQTNGQGSTDPSAGTHTYNSGDRVTITAYSSNGWKFDRWGGDASGASSSITIAMDSNKSVTAYFVKMKMEVIYVSLTISVSGGGTTNPRPDTYNYDGEPRIVFEAFPDPGWVFDRWAGVDSADGTRATVTMNSNKSVTAYFKEKERPKTRYTLTVKTSGQGDTNPSPGTYTYDAGDRVTIEAEPDTGWVFDRWAEVDSSDGTRATVTMNSNKSVIVYFKEKDVKKKTYTLTISSGKGGSTDPKPGKYTYNEGDQVTIQAGAHIGWEFDRWEGVDSSKETVGTVTVTSKKTVTAYFKNTAKEDIEDHISRYFSIRQLRDFSYGRWDIYHTYGLDVYSINTGKKGINKKGHRGLKEVADTIIEFVGRMEDSLKYQILDSTFCKALSSLATAAEMAHFCREAILTRMEQIVDIANKAGMEIAIREGYTDRGTELYANLKWLADVPIASVGPFQIIRDWDNPNNGLIIKEVRAWEKKDFGQLVHILEQEEKALRAARRNAGDWNLPPRLIDDYSEEQKEAFRKYKRGLMDFLDADLKYVQELRQFITQGDNFKAVDAFFSD